MRSLVVRTYVINDVDGTELYAGEAASQKLFVKELVSNGKSLARANLSRFNLSHLDLAGGDFAFACLDGADIRGSVVKGARFEGASMRGILASGVMAERADFTAADLSRDASTGKRSSFAGSTLTYARLDGAVLDGADLSGAAMSSSTFVGATAKRAKFIGAVLHNVDWVDSEIISCDFTRAVMRPTWRNAVKHLPERTYGATVIGNEMRHAELGEDNEAFRRDWRIGVLTRSITWAALTAGVVMAGSSLPIDEAVLFDNPLAKGAGFVLMTTAAILVKEKVEDVLKDSASEWASDITLAVRKCIAKAVATGRALGSLAAAFVTSRQADVILNAMHRPQAGFVARMKAVVSGDLEVLVCDRKSLADALARLTDAMVGRFRKDVDVIVTRSGASPGGYPQALVLRRDGSVEAVWRAEGTPVVRMEWDRDGKPALPGPGKQWQGGQGGRNGAIRAFIDSVLLDLDVPEMAFDPETHSVRRGKDRSVVVVRRSDGRLDNPHGPVILTPDREVITLTTRSRKGRSSGGTDLPHAFAAP